MKMKSEDIKEKKSFSSMEQIINEYLPSENKKSNETSINNTAAKLGEYCALKKLKEIKL